MRKMILLAVLAALAAMMLVASPAMASHDDDGWRDDCDWDWVRGEGWVLICDDDDDDFDRFDVFDDIDGVSFETGDVENESGDIELENSLSVEGDNSNVCVGNQQFANTGNFTNQQGVLPSGGGVFVDDDNDDRDHDWNWWNRDRDHHWNWWHHDDDNDRWWDDDDDRDRVFFGGAQADDIEFSGPDVTFAPSNETSCDQSVEQAAAASSWDDSWDW
jgi:hypothetical protein